MTGIFALADGPPSLNQGVFKCPAIVTNVYAWKTHFHSIHRLGEASSGLARAADRFWGGCSQRELAIVHRQHTRDFHRVDGFILLLALAIIRVIVCAQHSQW